MTSSEANNEQDQLLFSAESNRNIIPFDPYDGRIIQFTALRQLGYPVRIDSVEMNNDQLALLYPEDEIWQRLVERYSEFVRPVVTNTAFERFIEDLDALGFAFEEYDPAIAEQLNHHPMELVNHVDSFHISEIMNMLYDLRSTETKSETHTALQSGILTESLLERCYVAAFERAHQDPVYGDLLVYMSPTDEELQLLRELIDKKQKPVSPEELGGLMTDYYRQVETLVPEFRSFKAAE